MSDGWVKLHRQMLDCAELQDPLAIAVWVRLLLRASHKSGRVRWRGASIRLDAGQVVLSVREFAEECGLTYQRLRTMLNRFVTEKMLKISAVPNAMGSVLTICKYAQFQMTEAEANAASNEPATQYQRSSNAQNKNGRMEEGETESESLTLEKDTPPPAAKAVRKVAGYSAEFESLWATYPIRDEDKAAKRDCWKIWQTVIRSAEPVAIIAAARLYHAEHHDNEFRFGLRRWLKGQMWLHPVPPRRRDAAADPIGEADRMTRELLRRMEANGRSEEFAGTHCVVPDRPAPGVWRGPEDDGRALVVAEWPVH